MDKLRDDAAGRVAAGDHITLSERDSLQVFNLLENPPAPNAKLLAAARALPRES